MYMVWGSACGGVAEQLLFFFWFFCFLAFSSVALDTYIRFSWRGDGTAPRSWTYVQHAKHSATPGSGRPICEQPVCSGFPLHFSQVGPHESKLQNQPGLHGASPQAIFEPFLVH